LEQARYVSLEALISKGTGESAINPQKNPALKAQSIIYSSEQPGLP